MSLEHLSKPAPLMEIGPESSPYSMRWNSEEKIFSIGKKRAEKTLLELDYTTGRYVYAMLRAQQRIEELARSTKIRPGAITKDQFVEGLTTGPIGWSDEETNILWNQIAERQRIPDEHRNPALTHRHVYQGKEALAYVEDDAARSGLDVGARAVNIRQDCSAAAECYIEYARRETISTDIAYEPLPDYAQIEERLAVATKRGGFPLFIKIASRDPKMNPEPLWAHSCIVLGYAENEYICFEKVGYRLPWRLTTLRSIHEMYENDFVAANNDRPAITWFVYELPPKQ